MRIDCAPGLEEAAERIRLRLACEPDDAVRIEITAAGVRIGKEGESGHVVVELREVDRRARQGQRLALARACGVRAGLRVLDAAAGFGLDGLALAALGCRVHLVERSPLIFTMLEDAVERWRSANAPAGARVTIALADCLSLPRTADYDVVYLDPMFPKRRKSALPNRRAQLLAALVGRCADTGIAELMSFAGGAARERVVVKRRRRDPVLGTPAWQIVGERVRFDVYRPASWGG